MSTRSEAASRLRACLFPLLLVAGGGYTVSQCVGYGIGTILKPGAGFWPFLMGLLLAVCGGLLIADSVRSRPPEAGALSRRELSVIGSITVSLLLWGVASEYMGWVLSTCALSFVIAKLFGFAGFLKPLCLSLLLTAACYILFATLFTIDLPSAAPPYWFN